MPVTKHGSKRAELTPILIRSLIVAGIPAIIAFIVAINNPENWGGLYTRYAFSTFFVTLYFSLFVGIFGTKGKAAYRIFDALGLIMVGVFFVIHFTTMGETGGANLHLAVMALITYCIYKLTDADEDRGFFVVRNFAPFLTVAIGLINCLLFPWLGWNTFAFVLSNILMVIALITTIVSIVKFEKNHRIEDVTDDDYTYEEETQEDIIERGRRAQAAALARTRDREANEGGWVVTPTKDGYPFRQGGRWRLSDFIIKNLEEGIRKYSHEYVETANSMGERAQREASDSIRYDEAKSWVARTEKNYNRKIAAMRRFLDEISHYVFDSSSLGKYIVFDFTDCQIHVSPFSQKDSFKFFIPEFETTLEFGGLFSDKRTVDFYFYKSDSIPLDLIH